MKFSVIKQRTLWWTVSILITGVGIIAMGLSWQQFQAPLRPGLDFVGGTRLQLTRDCGQPQVCDTALSTAAVRDVLTPLGLEASSIQVVGDDRQSLSIRTKTLEVEQRAQLQETLEEALGPFDPQSIQIDSVGPLIGQQLFASGLLALLVAFAGIVAYLSLRFQLDYAVFAIIALFHDVFITLSIFAILGLTLGVEVDSLFIVALLTIVGFSVNDTVVIYDRIRETIKLHPQMHIDEVVDDSVRQTLSRSINTTLTTVLTLISIVLFGGDTLKFFALALIVGFVSGAYSSIFIASTLLALWREKSGHAIATPTPDPLPDQPDSVV